MLCPPLNILFLRKQNFSFMCDYSHSAIHASFPHLKELFLTAIAEVKHLHGLKYYWNTCYPRRLHIYVYVAMIIGCWGSINSVRTWKEGEKEKNVWNFVFIKSCSWSSSIYVLLQFYCHHKTLKVRRGGRKREKICDWGISSLGWEQKQFCNFIFFSGSKK